MWSSVGQCSHAVAVSVINIKDCSVEQPKCYWAEINFACPQTNLQAMDWKNVVRMIYCGYGHMAVASSINIVYFYYQIDFNAPWAEIISAAHLIFLHDR